MATNKELLIFAQNEQCQVVAKHRVSVLKALDELEEFGGTDDYETSLTAIVDHYGKNGISLTRVREVLPDAKSLETALEKLVTAGEIEKGPNKRSPLLKSLKQTETVKEPQPVTEDENPDAGEKDTDPAPVQVSSVATKKSAGGK
jgi:hypothetical protein